MIKDERQTEIMNILQEKQYASVAYLSKKLYASLPTIRRDLTILENKGYVRRSHGGAMIIDSEKVEIPVAFRNTKHMNEKIKMCKLAISLVNDNDVIFLDASTTVMHIADLLKTKENITVITNSIQVCNILYKHNIKVYCTGGYLIENSLAFVGKRAEEFVSDFRADIMFFSSCAFDNEGFVTDYSELETSVRKTMFKYAKKKVFLCDSSKFDKSSTFNVIHLKDLDHMISDVALPESLRKYQTKQII